MNSTIATDTDLWEAFRQGDSDAYALLMERNYRSLYSYGTKLTNDEELISYCIQEVFLELWHRRAALGMANSPRFYLLQALERRIQRTAYRDRTSGQSPTIDLDTSFSVEFAVETSSDTRQGRAGQLAGLINTLSPWQKRLIYLRFYQNLEFDEVAALLKTNRQSVYRLLRETLLRFRKNWERTLLPALFMLWSYTN